MNTQLDRARASRHPGIDTRDQLKAGQPKTKAAANIAFDVRRDTYGAIDVNFYKIRGQRLRREAMIETVSSICEYSRAWLRGRYKSISRHA